MTVKDVFELRKQGRIEDAYEAIRQLYASDKGPYASLAMFWTATDVLKKRVNEGRTDEARKIFSALERMLPSVPDKEGCVGQAFRKCQELLAGGEMHDHQRKEARDHHLQTGVWGEEYAAAYLRDKGYVILERDWHSGHRDIDIIAQQSDTIVFVEVKTRRDRIFADPVTAVGYSKLRNLRAAVNHYIRCHRLDNPVRFDVITVVGSYGTTHPEIEHIEDFQMR